MIKGIGNQPVMCLTWVRWLEVGEDDLEAPNRPFNRSCPAEGEMRWIDIYVGHLDPDDTLRIGQKRWMLYLPANALVNGFEPGYNARDLDECAVIEVELLQVFLPRRAHYGAPSYIASQCRCLQVLPLARIADAFPATTPYPVERVPSLVATVGTEVTYFEESCSGVREWYIVTNPAATPRSYPHLVLWSNNFDSYGFICNCVVECDKTSLKAA